MLRGDAEDFLYREAAVLDAHQYDAWLELWLPDADVHYWVPGRRGVDEPMVEPSHIYDDRANLELRVSRLVQRWPLGQDPPTPTLRSVHNVQVTQGDDGAAYVRSLLRMVELRRGDRVEWMGTADHCLVETPAGHRIRSKKVELIDADGPLPSISLIL